MRGSRSRIAVLLRWVGAAIGTVAAAAGCVTLLLTAACGKPCVTPDTAGSGSAGGEARGVATYAGRDAGAAADVAR